MYSILNRGAKEEAVNIIANFLQIDYQCDDHIDLVNKIIDYFEKERIRMVPFLNSALTIEYIIKKANIHDALTSIEDITSNFPEVNPYETFIYKVAESDESFIFNNLSKFKESLKCANLNYSRCRMSFEVKGQPRTGKTQCSKYVLPYFCAGRIKELRKEKGMEELKRAFVFYYEIKKNVDNIIGLYDLLEDKLLEFLGFTKMDVKYKSRGTCLLRITDYLLKLFKYHPTVHTFIVLDGIELLEW